MVGRTGNAVGKLSVMVVLRVLVLLFLRNMFFLIFQGDFPLRFFWVCFLIILDHLRVGASLLQHDSAAWDHGKTEVTMMTIAMTSSSIGRRGLEVWMKSKKSERQKKRVKNPQFFPRTLQKSAEGQVGRRFTPMCCKKKRLLLQSFLWFSDVVFEPPVWLHLTNLG